MGKVLPFSDLEQYLQSFKSKVDGCIVDSQFLIAILYELHTFHEDATILFNTLAKYEVPIFATVTTRSEFLDIQRKIIITEALMGMLGSASPWKLTKNVEKMLRKHKFWIDQQAAKDEMPILTDIRIKECKETFFPKNQSGKSGWLEICNYYLKDKLLNSWSLLETKAGINYLDMKDPNIEKYFPEGVNWSEMYKISERTCLGTSDAMIINMLNSSILPFAVSADYDMAFSIITQEKSKTLFTPDILFKNKIKKLNI
jgi:hypothetical protein